MVAAQAEIPLDTLIVMQRGNCEMGCPVYKVIVFGNGDVIYQGRHGVKKTGVVLSHLSPDKVREVIAQFERIDYLHIENIYGIHGTGCTQTTPDEPVVISYLAMHGESKTVSHHRGCVGDVSKKLSALEDSIEGIGGIKPLVR